LSIFFDSESVNAIDSARKQKPYQKIQGTTDPAVEDLRKQVTNLTEIATKQRKTFRITILGSPPSNVAPVKQTNTNIGE
jgi:predicted Zn-dependent protease